MDVFLTRNIDQMKMDSEITSLREQIKEKTRELSKQEGTPDDARPFTDLKPVDLKELNLDRFR
jgi:hypothetical protein